MSDFIKTTEEESLYKNLDQKSTSQLLIDINNEDKKVALAVANVIPALEKLVNVIVSKMNNGGRLFYIGAGTSGRLGVVDASECPPTFGVRHDMVIGIIAGGDSAIRKAVEFAEDDHNQAWKDLQEYQISTDDVVIGIAASGTTPYVIRGLRDCQKNNISTGCITCNNGSPITTFSDHPIVAVVGPEYVTGSTRMKSGTAQKLILNMITTTVFIKLGKVKGNRMIDMQLSNDKLVDRGTKMIMNKSNLKYAEANKLLLTYGSVRDALNSLS